MRGRSNGTGSSTVGFQHRIYSRGRIGGISWSGYWASGSGLKMYPNPVNPLYNFTGRAVKNCLVDVRSLQTKGPLESPPSDSSGDIFPSYRQTLLRKKLKRGFNYFSTLHTEGMCPGEGHIRREGLLFRGAQTAEDVRDVLCAIRVTQQHGGDQNDQFVP